ncbi:hypothetical protein B566_EDAN008020 [Ephemera danica]|nr:hypothetical protein B566_EDAN008020 [Ephemera danica]
MSTVGINMLSTFDCFLCCKKLMSKSSHDVYAPNKLTDKSPIMPLSITSKKNDLPQGRAENYTVRRVSRVAGTIAMEDLLDGKKHGHSDTNINSSQAKNKNEPKILINDKVQIKSDSGLWECPSSSSIEKSMENITMSNTESAANKPSKHSWHTTLHEKTHQIRSHFHKSSSPLVSTTSLAVSTPDLSIPLEGNETRITKAASPVAAAKRVQAATAVTLQVQNPTLATTWLKSQSMMNVANLSSAKDYGIDLSLYPEPTVRAAVSTPRDLHQPASAGNVLVPKRDETFAEMSHGTLHFAAGFSDGKLHVHVSHVEDLPHSETRKYTFSLRLAILPSDSKSQVKVSKTARDWGNPCRFKEDFELPVESLSGRTLRVSVCDTAAANGKYDAVDKYTTYVKASLYCKGQKVKSKKSAVISNEKDPFYNHMFQFPVGDDIRTETHCLVVSVVLKGRLKQDTPIGRVILGPNFYADGNSMTPWGRVILGQQTASHWYNLYL